MTPILKVTIGVGAGLGALVAALLVLPLFRTAPAAAPASGIKITFDLNLAKQGRQLFTSKYGCTTCHSVNSAGVGGGAIGPDLSRVILAEVPAGTRPGINPMRTWMDGKGLPNPETKPTTAAQLVMWFLVTPPEYAPTMRGQVVRFEGLAGGEKAWSVDVKALVEFLNEAASK